MNRITRKYDLEERAIQFAVTIINVAEVLETTGAAPCEGGASEEAGSRSAILRTTTPLANNTGPTH